MLNFKKKSIFSRQPTAEDVPQKQEAQGGILVVWGSPSSGKTVTAVKIAKLLADKKQNVVLLLCDMTAPMLPCICPPSELSCERSLGSILAAAHVTEALIKHNLVTLKRYSRLTLLGMKKGENEYSYPPYSEVQARELLQELRGIAPFVVVDCGSYIAGDILSAVALMEADSVLRLAGADLKSVSYLSSQLPLLRDKLKSALETSADSAPAKPEAPEAPAKPEVKGTLLETKLWKLTYPDEWSCEEGALHDEEERCDVELKIKDGESIVVSAYIGVRIEGYKAFRGNLNDKRIDAYAFVKEGSLPPVNIGGVDFATIDQSFAGKDERFCYGRMENANANITFFLRGETNDPRVEVLLSTLEFILPDVGNTDPLWPWEGVPFFGADGTGTVGSYNITSQWLPIDKPLTVFTYVDNIVEAVGDKLYILADGIPRQYALSSNALTHEKDFPLDSFYKKMSAGPDGTIYLSAFMEPFVGMRDGVEVFSHSARDTVAMHPSGDWGISYFIEPEVKKLTLADGEVVSEDLTFAEASSISNLYINQNHIFVCENSVANDNSSVFVYDLAGKLQYTLGDKKFMDTGSLGIVPAIVETANGFMVLDL